MKSSYPYHGAEIAIIGMAARFPGADSVDKFWEKLCQNYEGITCFSEEELADIGIPEQLLNDPNYVRAKGVLSDSCDFDAAFFDYNDREAKIMDPQLRIYHECAWHALEDAGYAGKNSGELIGIFGGASANALWTAQYAQVAEQGGAAAYEVINLVNRDFFNSRLSYKLDLKGPAVTVQTACSTSLVAVHEACQSLLSGDSDIALAGAVSLSLNPSLRKPEQQGYLYQEGMILSPDGHCRPFDQEAQGTVLSDGVGFVVLKRLQEAISSGDRIYGVIKGSAINNDGKEKIGYTAPSVNGQREVIEAALNVSEVDADTIGYIEAHGTGTNLGDPIEIQALLQAYQGFHSTSCYLGSVKSNVGHLDTAAGMAGLIKTVLAIKNSKIPATLNFNQLNAKCDIGSAKLKINSEVENWNSEAPLRAAVSSFGIGGTNAHIILEEYVDSVPEKSDCNRLAVLPLSARSEESLNNYREKLKEWLPAVNSISNVAYTLAEKRSQCDVRQAMVVDNQGNALFTSNIVKNNAKPELHFMFSGQGAQYPQMGKGLYLNEPGFRSVVDECLVKIQGLGGPDIRDSLFGEDASDEAERKLRSTDIAQLTLFVVEYALAKMFIGLGLKPKGLIGHSLGEYVAACVAGVFSLPDALKLVLARGRLMAGTEAGSMVAVHRECSYFNEAEWPQLSIAAINTEESFVVSGAESAIQEFITELDSRGVNFTRLRTSHAFHSPLMNPILSEFSEVLESIQFHSPEIPLVSNLTGNWVQAGEITTPDYWVSHLRKTVRFHQGLSRILEDNSTGFLEIGPGRTLSAFVRQHPSWKSEQPLLNSLRGIRDSAPDVLVLRSTLAELYAHGFALDWKTINPDGGKVCSLPGYAFDRRTYLPDVDKRINESQKTLDGIFYEQWIRQEWPGGIEFEAISGDCFILVLRSGMSHEDSILDKLVARGATLIEVSVGDSFQRLSDRKYVLRPNVADDYRLLSEDLTRGGTLPVKILNLWQADDKEGKFRPFGGMILLMQSLAQLGFNEPLSIYCVTEGAYRVIGDEHINENSALVYGAVRVIGQEYPHIRCHLLDFCEGRVSEQSTFLTSAVFSDDLPLATAWRGQSVWSREFIKSGDQWQVKSANHGFRQNGVYIITGGFGGLGSEIARYLAREYQARLVLCSRHSQSEHPLLSEIESLGGSAIAAQADMRSEESVYQLLDNALSRFGKLNGILHTAGIPGQTMIQRHQLDQAIDVIETKLGAASEMVKLAEEHALDLLVFFSSVTGVLGGFGQVDYCAANAGLDALAERARAQGLQQVYSVRWDAWRETGMAVDALNGKLELLRRTGHSLVGDLIIQTDIESIFSREVTVDTCWALNEHWVMGVPTIPGSTYLEMAGAAYSEITGEQEKQFSDVYFLSPMSLSQGESADLYTQLVADGASYSFEVGSYNRQRQHWQLHARGRIVPVTNERPCLFDITRLKEENQTRHLSDIQGAAHLGVLAMDISLTREQQEEMMKYGERWSVVKEVWLGEKQGLARLELPEKFGDDLRGMQIHPSLLDCATSYLRAFLDGGVYIPISYQRLIQYCALPAKFYSKVKLTSVLDSSLGAMSFDVQLLSEDGEVLADVREFTMRRIESGFSEASLNGRPLPIPDFVRQFRPMTQGLTSDVAISALEGIVRSVPTSPVVAASDFSLRYAQADTGDTGLFDVEQFSVSHVRPRPEISVEYLAPKTPIQRKLSEVWAQMLGYEQVGIQDDFFELGGDSLLLMQVHKKLQSILETDVAVVELYNYPTIQKLADYLVSQQGGSAQDVTLIQVSDRTERQKAAAARRKNKRKK